MPRRHRALRTDRAEKPRSWNCHPRSERGDVRKAIPHPPPDERRRQAQHLADAGLVGARARAPHASTSRSSSAPPPTRQSSTRSPLIPARPRSPANSASAVSARWQSARAASSASPPAPCVAAAVAARPSASSRSSDYPDRWAPARAPRSSARRMRHRGDTKENCSDYACIANLDVPRMWRDGETARLSRRAQKERGLLRRDLAGRIVSGMPLPDRRIQPRRRRGSLPALRSRESTSATWPTRYSGRLRSMRLMADRSRRGVDAEKFRDVDHDGGEHGVVVASTNYSGCIAPPTKARTRSSLQARGRHTCAETMRCRPSPSALGERHGEP